MGRHHPNLYVFLEALQKEEEYSEKMRRCVDLGEGPPRRKRKYEENDARIERIVRRYREYREAEGDLLEGDWNGGLLKYMRTLGHSSRRVFI